MATSGTYAFDPIIGTLFLSAFSRIKVKRTELTPQHIEDAKLETNYLQVEWANRPGVPLWEQVLRTFTMVPGQATYSINPNTVMVLDLYVSPNAGSAQNPQNRLIYPFSRTDYASLANPLQTGFPTSFFFLRTNSPTLTFWPVPDNNTTYQCSYWCFTQMQDAVPANGGNLDIQYRFIDAFVAGLAHRLSRGYSDATTEALRKADYTEAMALAMEADTENVPMYMTPGLAGYFRP